MEGWGQMVEKRFQFCAKINQGTFWWEQVLWILNLLGPRSKVGGFSNLPQQELFSCLETFPASKKCEELI
jgi:hypothetical protein